MCRVSALENLRCYMNTDNSSTSWIQEMQYGNLLGLDLMSARLVLIAAECQRSCSGFVSKLLQCCQEGDRDFGVAKSQHV